MTKIQCLKHVTSRFHCFSLFLADFSKCQNEISKRLSACFGTKNDVEEGNGLFFHIFTKKGKTCKKGTVYVNFSEILNFQNFERNFTFNRLGRLESACCHFFGGGAKILCFVSFHHK